MAKKTSKPKKTASPASPLQKQVEKTLRSGTALSKAKQTHADNQKELKRLEEEKGK